MNKIGINNNRIDIYNNLWNFTYNTTINSGFGPSLYTTWQLRRLLQGRITVDRFNNITKNYINLDNNMVELFNRLVSSSYGDILPFIRQINFMFLTIIGNIALLFTKNFLKTTILGALTTIFTCLTGTIGILWTPSLADIASFLNFALRMKSFIDYILSFLPGNLFLPIPQLLKDKINLEDNLLFHLFIFILFIIDFVYLNGFNKTLYFMFILHILIDFIDTAKTRNLHLMEIYYWNKNHLNLYVIFLHVIRIILIISLILLLLLQFYNILFL